jgi:REP element-mobilizing transposase RayT
MVLGYHLIFSAYGFWLPNDPRGSWSDLVASWELLKFGQATRVTGKRSYARDPHDPSLRRAAKTALKYPPVRFDALQRDAIAEGFALAVSETNYQIRACCIGHDHVHLVMNPHIREISQIAGHLKANASRVLNDRGIHPLRDHTGFRGRVPSPWSVGFWNVFLWEEAHLRSAIQYVNRHPEKEGLSFVRYPFVQG